MQSLLKSAMTAGRTLKTAVRRRKGAAVVPWDGMAASISPVAMDMGEKEIRGPSKCWTTAHTEFISMSLQSLPSMKESEADFDTQAPVGAALSMDFDDDVMSLWTAGESLAISEDSFCSEESEDKMTPSGARPPLIPGTPSQKEPVSPFDGNWVLCTQKGRTADWLDHLTIDGGLVVDGNGKTCRLPSSRRGPVLFGGLLKRKGASLVRIGKSGGVQVYLRAEA